jgi:hypothetical protein
MTKQSKPITPCKKCQENDKFIASLLKRLDVERHAQGELVMYPGTDMRLYAISVAIASLLNREREIIQIESVLLDAEIRAEGDIVGAVKRAIWRDNRDKK